MTSFVLRRKSDKQFIGVVVCTYAMLFDKIDEICDPYGVQFTTYKFQHNPQIIWNEFTGWPYGDGEPLSIVQSSIESCEVGEE